MQYIKDDPDESRKPRRLRSAEVVIMSLAQYPFCSQYLFILIAFDSEIKELFSVDYYNQIFKQAYKNTPDIDIDTLIRLK